MLTVSDGGMQQIDVCELRRGLCGLVSVYAIFGHDLRALSYETHVLAVRGIRHASRQKSSVPPPAELRPGMVGFPRVL